MKVSTGVYSCSFNSPNLPAPDTQITNADGNTLCQVCLTRWVGRGEVGITCFLNILAKLPRPVTYKRSKQYVCEKYIVMFTPHVDQFREA